MKRIKIAAVSIFLALTVLVVVGILPPEGHFLPNPYIDTIFAEKFTWEKYNEVKDGMKSEEVKNLIGEPIGKLGMDTKNACWQYSTDGKAPWWDFSFYQISVCFKDGFVESKPINEFFN